MENRQIKRLDPEGSLLPFQVTPIAILAQTILSARSDTGHRSKVMRITYSR